MARPGISSRVESFAERDGHASLSPNDLQPPTEPVASRGNGPMTNGELLLRAARQRIEARRAHERLQVVMAILVVTFGLAPLTHELTAAAVRPKPRSIVPGAEAAKETSPTNTDPPPLLPLLVSLAVAVGVILLAGIVHTGLKPWDDTSEALARDLKRLLERDGNDDVVWRFDMAMNDTDPRQEHFRRVKGALKRHDDEGYPAVAPVRFVFGGILPLATLLSLVLLAASVVMRMNISAVPAAEWASHAHAAADQGRKVLGGPASPLTLLAAMAISGAGLLALAIGWVLGRSTLLVSADMPPPPPITQPLIPLWIATPGQTNAAQRPPDRVSEEVKP